LIQLSNYNFQNFVEILSAKLSHSIARKNVYLTDYIFHLITGAINLISYFLVMGWRCKKPDAQALEAAGVIKGDL